MVDNLLAAAHKNAEGGYFGPSRRQQSPSPQKRDREMDKAVQQAITGSVKGLYRDVYEARAKFKVEAAEDVKWVIDEAIIAVKEWHYWELCKAVDKSILEKEEAAVACLDRVAAQSGSGEGEN